MASDLKNRLVQLCQTLKDPHHVASFQQFCGIRGRFSRDLCETGGQKLQNGHHCYQGESDMGNLKGDGEGKTTDNVWRRKCNPAVATVNRDSFKNGLSNGTMVIPGAGEAVPFGANSGAHVGKGPMETSENIPGDGCILDRNVDAIREDPSYGSTAKPRRKNSLTGDTGHEFLIENKPLYYLFTFGTELGNELFYITFFPFFIWNIDAFVGRRLILVWVWVMYLGQCTKDVIRWSRPASPPVVKVEMFYNSEYSMPSTHAMSGTAIPFSLILLTYGRWEYPTVLGLLVALSWCILVCVSRIYMGMHSILDVIAGHLYSVLILVLFYPALDVVDTFNQTFPYAPLVIISLHLGLGLFSFTLDTWSTSRGDTAQILGTGAGIALGAHLNHRLDLLRDPLHDQLPFALPALSTALLARVTLRMVLGVLVLLAARAAMKAVTIPLVCHVTAIASDDVRKARQHMEVELPYRYIVYGTVGISCSFVVPLLFSGLGLS